MIGYFSKNAVVSLPTANVVGFVPFDSAYIDKGNTVNMNGTTTAQINNCGVYDAECYCCFNSSVAADITIQLYVDNAARPETEMVVTADAYTDYVVSFGTDVIKTGNNTCCPCTTPTNLRVAVSSSVADTDVTFLTSNLKVYRVPMR